MKKLTLLFAGIAFVASLSSCKKDYVCKCTSGGVAYETALGKQKKKDAEDACAVFSTGAALNGGSCTTEKK